MLSNRSTCGYVAKMYSAPRMVTTRSSAREMLRCASRASAPSAATDSKPAYAPTAKTTATNVSLVVRCDRLHCAVSMLHPYWMYDATMMMRMALTATTSNASSYLAASDAPRYGR